jgi:hypothetical protein
MIIPLRTAIAPVALTLLIVAQLWVGVVWIQADGSLGDGVCCSFTSPVFEILMADGTDQLGWPWSTYRRSMGLLVWPALAARKLVGANPDFLLWLNLSVIVTTQALLYDLGRRLADRFAGLMAAGIYPMIPAVALMGRRWDVMVHQHLLLVAAAGFAVRSQGFSRWRPTMGFGLMAVIGAILSARETDNLLFMAAVGAMALGVTIQGLIAKHRLKTGLISLALAAAMAVFMVMYAFPLVDFGYFQDELGNRTYVAGAQRLSLSAITAYPWRLYTDDFTPWLITPFALALIPFLRRGQGRTMLGIWLLLPLAALSLVAKKNYYYAAIIYPTVPLILGVGLSVFKPRAVGILVGVCTLVTSWAQFSSRSLPTSTFPAALSQVRWTGDAGPQQHLFQGIVPLNLGPRGRTDHWEAIAMMTPRVETSSCSCPNHTLFMGKGDVSDLQLSLAVRDPCMSMSTWPRLDHPDSVGWVVVESPGCTDRPPPGLMAKGFSLVEAKGGNAHCVSLWARDAGTPGRFCGTLGSPPD